MRLIRTRGRLFALVLCATVFFADRLTKVMVLNNALLTEGKEIGFINGILSFSFVWNYGAAFSVLREHPEWLTAITGMILILIAFVVFAPRQEDLLSRLSLSLVLGGGLGNFADRLLHGAVVDFIRLDFINFPIFNAADIAVTAGVVIFGIGMLWPDGRKGNG